MPRRIRIDYPDAWHHVYNRGLAKRPMFEGRGQVERFLELVGGAVAKGELEVHAYCVMTTHFHALVRSVNGRLSTTMGWFENQYVRWFNRRRRRDGPLVRGRFGSRLVVDPVQWENVVRYVHRNPVHARICELPSEYPFGSAADYTTGGGPAWLTREAVEAVVGEGCASGPRPEGFDSWALCVPEEVVVALVEAQEVRSIDPLRFDDLLEAASPRDRAWLEYKTRLADGRARGSATAAPSTLLAILGQLRGRRPELRASPRGAPGSLWTTLEVGLLRELCGWQFRELAARLDVSAPRVHVIHDRHRHLAASDERYRRLFVSVARRALRRDIPPSTSAARRLLTVNR